MMLSRIDCGQVKKMNKKSSKEKLQDGPRESDSVTSHLESKVLSPGDVDPAEVLTQFLPIIRRMAGVLASRNPYSLDIEDLTSAGAIGLLSALARFDPSREIKFRTFAEYRIRGMMLDEMRAMDWVPRSVRSRNDQVRQAMSEFVKTAGRLPARDEIAEVLGMTQQELDASSTKETQFLSLDDPIGNEEETYTLKDVVPDSEHPDPFASCLSSETNKALDSAILNLSDRQQEVVQLYYFVGLTMKEIGLRLGLTESGVCRIHSEAVRRLRGEMKTLFDELPPLSVSLVEQSKS